MRWRVEFAHLRLTPADILFHGINLLFCWYGRQRLFAWVNQQTLHRDDALAILICLLPVPPLV